MRTECNQESFTFHALGRREIVARFDGGRITSDAGGLLSMRTTRCTKCGKKSGKAAALRSERR